MLAIAMSGLCAMVLALSACGLGGEPATATIPAPSPTPRVAVRNPPPTRRTTPANPPPVAAATVGTVPPATRGTVAIADGSPTRGTETPWGMPLPVLPTGQPHDDAQGRFSLTVPIGWTRLAIEEADVTFSSPPDRAGSSAGVNVVRERVPAGTDLDGYNGASEAVLGRDYPDFRLFGLTRVTVDGRPAYKRVFTATVGGRPTQLQQVTLIDRETAYIVTCAAPREAFALFSPLCEQIAGTFRIGADAGWGRESTSPVNDDHIVDPRWP